jgi:hypothetical protein
MRYVTLFAYSLIGMLLTLELINRTAGYGWALIALFPVALGWAVWSLWAWENFFLAWDSRHDRHKNDA